MFNNSIAVISRATARFKKAISIVELFIQLLFVGYYAYLLVVHLDDLILLIGYSILITLGLSIFVVMIFTLDPYHKKALEFRRYIRRVLRVVSWTGKVLVIGYNIYYLIRFGMTETGQLLLVFSIIIFVSEVILFIVSSILSYYSQLFVYALKMDYQRFIGEEDIGEKPIGRVLLKMNNSTDYEDEVTMLFVEQEIYEAVKKYAEKEEHDINRHKVEKQLLAYYIDSIYYFNNKEKLEELYNAVNQVEINKDSQHFYVLKFFLTNEIEKTYYGLSSQYIRFVFAGLSIYIDYQNKQIIDIVYQIIIKQLVNNKDWNKLLNPVNTPKKSFFSFLKGKENTSNETLSSHMYNEVNEVIKKSVEEAELELKKTVSTEIEGIVSNTIKKKVSGSIKSSIKGFFRKKK